jgi:hypothetical protein
MRKIVFDDQTEHNEVTLDAGRCMGVGTTWHERRKAEVREKCC